MGGSTSRLNFSRQGDAPAAVHDPAAPVDFIRESERLFRAIGGSAPAIVWMDDTEGRCIYLNRSWCDFTGLSEADGLGEGWSNAVHPEDRDVFRKSFPTAAAERLIARRVPIVFATGYDAAALLPAQLRDVPTLQKPVDTAVLVRILASMTAPHA